MTTSTATSTVTVPIPDKPTMGDVSNSLTGYDEIAITREFDHDFAVLVNYPTKLGRALIFILKRREGLTDKEAKKFSMNLTLGEVDQWFADESDDDEDPEDAAGEDGSQPA